MQRLADMGVNFIEEKSVGNEKEKDFTGIRSGEVVILPAFGANLAAATSMCHCAYYGSSYNAETRPGASVQEMKLLNDRGVQIIDTTCPWVSKVL